MSRFGSEYIGLDQQARLRSRTVLACARQIEHGHAPQKLTSATLSEVAKLMIDPKLDLEPAEAAWNHGDGLPLIINPVINPHNSLLPAYDISLTRQIGRIIRLEPSIIFFTAHSAIPVADVFRGIYAGLSKKTPQIGIINTKSQDEFSTKDLDTTIRDIQEIHSKPATAMVVDQYVASGNTLATASHILQAAGLQAEHIYPVLGCWFHEADKQSLDTSAVTSLLAPQMYQIGIDIVKSVQNTNSSVINI